MLLCAIYAWLIFTAQWTLYKIITRCGYQFSQCASIKTRKFMSKTYPIRQQTWAEILLNPCPHMGVVVIPRWFLFFECHTVHDWDLKFVIAVFWTLFTFCENFRYMWSSVREIWPRSRGHVTAKMTDLPCRVRVSRLTHHWCHISWLLCKIHLQTAILSVLLRHHQVKYKVKVIRGHPWSPDVTNSFCLWLAIEKSYRHGNGRIAFVSSNHMTHREHDLISPPRCLDLGLNLDLDLSRWYNVWFGSPWRDKQDGAKRIALSWTVLKVFKENDFPENTNMFSLTWTGRSNVDQRRWNRTPLYLLLRTC